MLLRKRALALRKFTVIRRDDGMPLEEDPEFRWVGIKLSCLNSQSICDVTSLLIQI